MVLIVLVSYDYHIYINKLKTLLKRDEKLNKNILNLKARYNIRI